MIEYNEEIDAKAKRIIENQLKVNEYICRCVEVRICPKCGSPIQILPPKTWTYSIVTYYRKYTCTNPECAFTFEY